MIQSSDSPLSKYKNQNKIHLFQIETTRSDHLFLPEDHNEVV